MSRISSSQPRDGFAASEDGTRVVTVNVGGQRFTTQLGTLRAYRGSVLATLFTPPYAIHQDPTDGSFFLDRNGDVFSLILDYLRTGTLVVPRDPVLYSILRREVAFYQLPITAQLPPALPLSWEPAPVRFKHARITLDEVEKTVEWEEGALPADIHTRQMFEIVNFFTARGYKVASEYTTRGSRGYASIWLTKKEAYPGANMSMEVSADDPPYAQQRRMDLEPKPYSAPPAAMNSVGRTAFDTPNRSQTPVSGRTSSMPPPPPGATAGGSMPSTPGMPSGGPPQAGGSLPRTNSMPPPPAASHGIPEGLIRTSSGAPSSAMPTPGVTPGPAAGESPGPSYGPGAGGGQSSSPPGGLVGARTTSTRAPGSGSQFGSKLPLKMPPPQGGSKLPLKMPHGAGPSAGGGGYAQGPPAGGGPSFPSPPNPWN